MCCHRRFEWSLGETEFVEIGVEQIANYVGIYTTIVEQRAQIDDTIQNRCATVEQCLPTPLCTSAFRFMFERS